MPEPPANQRRSPAGLLRNLLYPFPMHLFLHPHSLLRHELGGGLRARWASHLSSLGLAILGDSHLSSEHRVALFVCFGACVASRRSSLVAPRVGMRGYSMRTVSIKALRLDAESLRPRSEKSILFMGTDLLPPGLGAESLRGLASLKSLIDNY